MNKKIVMIMMIGVVGIARAKVKDTSHQELIKKMEEEAKQRWKEHEQSMLELKENFKKQREEFAQKAKKVGQEVTKQMEVAQEQVEKVSADKVTDQIHVKIEDAKSKQVDDTKEKVTSTPTVVVENSTVGMQVESNKEPQLLSRSKARQRIQEETRDLKTS